MSKIRQLLNTEKMKVSIYKKFKIFFIEKVLNLERMYGICNLYKEHNESLLHCNESNYYQSKSIK